WSCGSRFCQPECQHAPATPQFRHYLSYQTIGALGTCLTSLPGDVIQPEFTLGTQESSILLFQCEIFKPAPGRERGLKRFANRSILNRVLLTVTLPQVHGLGLND